MTPARVLFGLGLLLTAFSLVAPMGLGPTIEDVIASGNPRLEFPLAGVPARPVTFVVEVPDTEQWERIRHFWGDPGYIVYARDDRQFLIPFGPLKLAVDVSVQGRVLSLERASFSPYGLSADLRSGSADYGVSFQGNPGERISVTLKAAVDLAMPAGTLVVEPYWGGGMKDHIVSATVMAGIRRALPFVGLVGLGLALVGFVLSRRSA